MDDGAYSLTQKHFLSTIIIIEDRFTESPVIYRRVNWLMLGIVLFDEIFYK